MLNDSGLPATLPEFVDLLQKHAGASRFGLTARVMPEDELAAYNARTGEHLPIAYLVKTPRIEGGVYTRQDIDDLAEFCEHFSD